VRLTQGAPHAALTASPTGDDGPGSRGLAEYQFKFKDGPLRGPATKENSGHAGV
jgi:hypothetical protein